MVKCFVLLSIASYHFFLSLLPPFFWIFVLSLWLLQDALVYHNIFFYYVLVCLFFSVYSQYTILILNLSKGHPKWALIIYGLGKGGDGGE